MAREVILIRHGSTIATGSGQYCGATDLGLSAMGRHQASRLARPLANWPEHAFTSPLVRAQETARQALPAGDACVVDPDLAEVDFGKWEGLNFTEIEQSYQQHLNAWAAYRGDFTFPGGESLAAFHARIHRAGERLASSPGSCVVAFTHAGVIRALICYYLGLEPQRAVIFEVAPASYSVVRLFNSEGASPAGQGVLIRLNDICHLNEG